MNARAPSLGRLVLGLCFMGSLMASCTTDDAARGAQSQGEPPPTRLAVPALAVRLVEAPGLNIDDLTPRVRNAVERSSGAPCVDELAVRAELASCTEAPCADTVARQFRDASVFVDSSVSLVGDAMLATVRIQRGVDELVRATSANKDARVALEDAGAKAGTALRERLLKEGAEPLATTDPTLGDVDPTAGRADDTTARPDPAATERGD